MNKEPIIIFDDNNEKGKSIKSNIRKETRLLQGIIIHPDNLKAAARHAGIRTMADTYRTLDRLTLRKDYQTALQKHGVDMTFLVTELKSLATNADLDSTRLKAIQIFLKSLGLETYGKEEEGAEGWEKIVQKAIQVNLKPNETPTVEATAYVVNTPKIPDLVKKERDKENDLGKELYDQ